MQRVPGLSPSSKLHDLREVAKELNKVLPSSHQIPTNTGGGVGITKKDIYEGIMKAYETLNNSTDNNNNNNKENEKSKDNNNNNNNKVSKNAPLNEKVFVEKNGNWYEANILEKSNDGDLLVQFLGFGKLAKERIPSREVNLRTKRDSSNIQTISKGFSEGDLCFYEGIPCIVDSIHRHIELKKFDKSNKEEFPSREGIGGMEAVDKLKHAGFFFILQKTN